MRLSCIGAAHEVTGSCHLLEACGKNILIDCGMEQGPDLYENQEIPVTAKEIDYILLTHAHIDHSGKIPLLCRQGFKGDVVTTFATSDLCNIMLRDSAHIQESESEWRNRKAKRSGEETYEPLYTMEDADAAIKLLAPCDYGQKITLCEGIEVRFNDMGHLLGSASIEVWITEDGISKKVVFSGDVGNTNQPIIRDPQKVAEADYVVIESTYGDRTHGDEVPDYIGEFTKILKETFDKGGNVVIPSFAVGRTQELLYFIREIKEKRLLPQYQGFEVYVDSPLAIEATNVFNKNVKSCFDEEAMALVEKGISGHADMNGLLNWLKGFTHKPDRVIVVHGEDTVTDHFAKLVEDTIGCPTFAPYSGGCVDLASNEILSEGVKMPKKAAEKPARAKATAAFGRVVAAAKRLLDVVYKNEGIANKDLAKFENQIQNLTDKWDRD